MRVAGTLLTIAGFDPSSGAGITADLQVFHAHGHFGLSAISALTVQSTVGVRAVSPTDPQFLADTLSCLAGDLPIAGVKIGMLATEANVAVVSDFLERLSPKVPVVLDPVLQSTSGAELLSAAGLLLLRTRLLPLCTWATPNRRELSLLANSPATHSDLSEKAEILLRESGLQGLVITGGDEATPDDLVLTPGARRWLEGKHIDTRSTHGTGCAFSSALLCGLVNGDSGADAASEAKAYVREAMLRAIPLGHGRGPMHLLWPLHT